MIQLVVFDLAGTTVHDGDAVNRSFRETLATWKIEVNPTAVNAVMGLPKPEAIRILLDQFGRSRGIEPTAKNIDAIHDDFTRRMIAYYATAPDVREIPGAGEAFLKLRQAGVKVALNTGFFRPIVDALLARLGWRVPETIDAVVTSDSVPHGRPHPDMIHRAMQLLGVVDPRFVAKVGDTQVDLEEGTNAGCGLVVGVTTGASTREQLSAYPHTHIVESVAEVPQLILGNSG